MAFKMKYKGFPTRTGHLDDKQNKTDDQKLADHETREKRTNMELVIADLQEDRNAATDPRVIAKLEKKIEDAEIDYAAQHE